ncbi:general transcription factor II-I repeat domain-containing protein 2 [Anabrus simplex]|uniref:general transcription factor II-I repeat domain-containing protein 2 n=1 Tax=Anabrus simplex TaxID=316456 RepID=UPI0034DD1E57
MEFHTVPCIKRIQMDAHGQKRAHNPYSYFNPQWEELYMFVENDGLALCLICHKTLQVLKKFNVRRHYVIYHAKDYAHLEDEERTAVIAKLKENLSLTDQQKLEETTESCDFTPEEPSVPKKRPKTESTFVQEVREAVNLLNHPTDNEQIFGDYVASELRELKMPANKRKLKRLINQAIMDVAECDASDWESSRSNVPSPFSARSSDLCEIQLGSSSAITAPTSTKTEATNAINT